MDGIQARRLGKVTGGGGTSCDLRGGPRITVIASDGLVGIRTAGGRVSVPITSVFMSDCNLCKSVARRWL